MKSIGFKNFKKFKACPDLELAGINYLVGKNNAGKTSFSQAARLAANFISQVETGGNFEPVFNFEFEKPSSTKYRGYNHVLHKGTDTSGSIEFDVDYGDYIVSFGIWKKHNYFAFIRDRILDWVYDSYYSQYPDSTNEPEIDPDWLQAEIDKSFKDFQTKNPEKYQERLMKDAQGKGDVRFIRYYDKQNRIIATVDIQHCSVEIMFDDCPKDVEEELSRLQGIVDTLPREDQPSVRERIEEMIAQKEALQYSIKRGNLQYKGRQSPGMGLPVFWSIEKLVQDCLQGRNVEDFPNDDGFDFAAITESLNQFDRRERLESFGETFSSRLWQQIPSASAHIGHFTDDENTNMELFREFLNSKLDENRKLTDTINKWISAMEIGDALEVRPAEDGKVECVVKCHTEINRQRHDYELPFDFFGVGSRQLIILLINFGITISKSGKKKYPTLITIEEPEQNLHPAVQSRLADMFLDFYRQFGSQCIIETHSEYIIRRTQVLVAEGIRKNEFSLENNPMKVYYFPDNGQPPYDMCFKQTGRFERDFGPGFFDVAGNSNLELLDLASLIKK